MSDEKLTDGMKLTLDAIDEGRLDALREFETLLHDLWQTVHDRIARIESQRDTDD